MKLSRKEKEILADRIRVEGIFKETTGNETYENNFYSFRNRLANIQLKNGRLHDVIIYGL